MGYKERQTLDNWDLKSTLGFFLILSMTRIFGLSKVPAENFLEIAACLLLAIICAYSLYAIHLRVRVDEAGISFRRRWWQSYRRLSWQEVRRIEVLDADQSRSTAAENDGKSSRDLPASQLELVIHRANGMTTFIKMKYKIAFHNIFRMGMKPHI